MILTPEEEVDLLKKTKAYYKKKTKAYYKHGKKPTKYDYYQYAVGRVVIDGLWLEFGVASGGHINRLAKLMNLNGFEHKIIYGFDSFEGLPESWADPITGIEQCPAGAFDQKGKLPRKKYDNIKFIKGWFDQSLPGFVEKHTDPVALLHIDSDLYSSAKTIFDYVGDQIVPGTIILFDEFYNYPGYEYHEYKAFKEFVEKKDVKYEWISHVGHPGRQATLIILEVN